ncbi:response regulator [Azospirillum sp. RWY-5-1]|uniref:Response regulator n=1 Tax=Azospirillum oleiclasticum TaxID=2735135 RepID=A0ABX2TGC2_9PROT|nr:response regulator [Azospirillum oleiclasticum]NYZ14792.1 response regulator [Azospirillum oleiclasticum]NYZ22222.1 response regulator [Azospirillum oleiclasticum]
MTTILVVDDSRLARDMVASVIGALRPDWTVIVATDGKDALAKVEGAEPQAAVLDFNMPGMDGLALAEILRERFPGALLGLLTANVQDALRRRAEAVGCRFIPKPVTADKMREFFAAAGL